MTGNEPVRKVFRRLYSLIRLVVVFGFLCASMILVGWVLITMAIFVADDVQSSYDEKFPHWLDANATTTSFAYPKGSAREIYPQGNDQVLVCERFLLSFDSPGY